MANHNEKIKQLLRIERASPTKEDGRLVWKLPDGRKHRDFGPAVIYPSGEENWFRYGQLHRTIGPAITTVSGQFWFHKGKRHRLNGPAVIYSDGSREWWFFGFSFHHFYGILFLCGLICLVAAFILLYFSYIIKSLQF
jgi:hypothetical protein